MAAAFLELIAALAGVGGQPRLGAQLLGAAAALRETYHYPIELPDQPRDEERVMTARANLGEAEFAAAWAQG